MVQQETTSRRATLTAQTIVLAAPSVEDAYYQQVFQDIVDFQIGFATKINGRDKAIILVDQVTRKYYADSLPEHVLVQANMEDIWIRDYSPVIADKQVKFTYSPNYMSRAETNDIDNSFESWHHSMGLQYSNKSSLILDGGNVVGNGNGKIIVTNRFLQDNPTLTKLQAKRKLKSLLGAKQVAIIQETPGDATGHADGMLMWTEENTLLVHDPLEQVKEAILKELTTSFPAVKIVIVPDYYQFEEWNGFTSAANVYVNSLVTNNYIYVPTFNNEHDQEMLDFIQSHTIKEVVEIPSEKVSYMGGSVRCLSWQLDSVYAAAILKK